MSKKIDHLQIALRAFATSTNTENGLKKSKRKRKRNEASEWAVIFDTETHTDASQSLRFGTYQVRKSGALIQAGIFHDPNAVSAKELETLRTYADTHSLCLIDRDAFAEEILFKIGYECRARIIGFNLPFDISRVAIDHDSARGGMRGGFTFKLSYSKTRPHIQVKHLSQRAAFIQFTALMRQRDGRSTRQRGGKTPVRRGHFVDVKTLAGALFARSFSLANLSEFLKVENPKLEFDDFNGPVTPEMVSYAVRDVQATWECAKKLFERLDMLGLPALQPEQVYSEASIGKACLSAMGISSWLQVQDNVPPQIIANIFSAYFGGRSEVRIRREARQVMLCDFLSMYPTVCTLMGLWRFVIAEGMTWRDATEDAKGILTAADLDWLQRPQSWQSLAMLVRVKPDDDVFPVRAAYGGEVQSTIGLNHLSSDCPLWFTMADCINAKLRTGRVPAIVEAMSFVPGPAQEGLSPIKVSGNADYTVDPVKDDLFKRVIELRQSLKQRRKTASEADGQALDTEQNALKILANATSYGIYVEVNVAGKRTKESLSVHCATGDAYTFQTDKVEETGPFFHPLLATLITGAARLMLGIAESLVENSGLEWCFCDTDSMAIARANSMDADIFAGEVANIIGWFEALNPYAFGGSILKSEDVNTALDESGPGPLYCWAISAKRYALFNLDADGVPVMRKVSAHGLGHLIAPYKDDAPAAGIPEHHPTALAGVHRWQADLWWQIVSAALAGHTNQVALDFHPPLGKPAVSRYGATSPDLLRWFKGYNEDRHYSEQVKPFNFLLSLTPRLWSDAERIIEGKRRRRKPKMPKPVAPFSRDPAEASRAAFDRETGEPVDPARLKTYAEALHQYHLHPEAKFLNGDFLDTGTTRRRHVMAESVRHIGKESNDWERQAVLGLDDDAMPDYGMGEAEMRVLAGKVKAFVDQVGWAKAAWELGVTTPRLKAFIANAGCRKIAQRVTARLSAAAAKWSSEGHEKTVERQKIYALIQKEGLRGAARTLKIDPSNLRRAMKLPDEH